MWGDVSFLLEVLTCDTILIMFAHMQDITNGTFHHQHFSTNDVIFDEMYGNTN